MAQNLYHFTAPIAPMWPFAGSASGALAQHQPSPNGAPSPRELQPLNSPPHGSDPATPLRPSRAKQPPSTRTRRKWRRADSDDSSQASFAPSERLPSPATSSPPKADTPQTNRSLKQSRALRSDAQAVASNVEVVPAIPRIGVSAAGIDLNSTLANQTPNFSFVDADLYHTDILVFGCTNPLMTCLLIKRFLLEKFASAAVTTPSLLRMESQDLYQIRSNETHYLVLLESAVHMNANLGLPLTVYALINKQDHKIRWFYSIFRSGNVLKSLSEHGCLTESVKKLHAHSIKHKRLLVFLREAFLNAARIPDAPDYLEAQKLTDYALPVVDPETAFNRIAANEELNRRTHHPDLTLGPDRYARLLEPVEAFLALNFEMTCAAYLLAKRRFYCAFWKDLVMAQDTIGDGRRKVRSEAAHEAWLVQTLGWRASRAKRIVLAWKILGLLQEDRYLDWLKRGGMFEEA
ncbi:hypothetical protein BAUCODRAFT_356011 [Baudoinia panamericana UAMH 10762]|uniref:Uncharacterized protein n=1 Tax=Baudoinia panamericana (strain UAMH 10762) TaxID=717646 RepID=M2MST0_BAUPA|nr:uncharacterized protein BAUCODRAFT_356011 [Baudoinia panamericana UAMH 10762]EMC99931.1 hypothetical protein BAUCODRAFT_356011 [Baudoinia panamericana UAMH 10762]